MRALIAGDRRFT